MRKLFEFGGLIAAVVLIGFGIGAIVMSINGRDTVRSSLKLEQITGTPDMTPVAIKAEATKAGLKDVTYPTCSVAGKGGSTPVVAHAASRSTCGSTRSRRPAAFRTP